MVTRIISLCAVGALLVTGLTLTETVSTEPAVAADLTQFDPGNIISDGVFFDKNTMTEGDIQAFIQGRIGSCATGATCLINWTGTTTTRAADARCSTYWGAANEPASRVIYKVAQACGINPQVLIVMLQKEQGLVTSRSPSAYAWRSAMGYGCPDTAPCDAQYYGFFNQVYQAASQLQRYTQNPNSYGYRAGRYNTIQWHPNAGCGSSSVYIQNQATANLYIYTPYRPNQAALNAGYSVGDSCSSYGNRNFYNYFADWFGPTTYYVPGAIGTFWRSIGASASEVGSPAAGAAAYTVNGGGWTQEFTKGYIYVTTAGHAAALRKDSAIFAEYARNGSQYGAYGWPVSSERCSQSECLAVFDTAAIGWTAIAGLITIRGDALNAYAYEGYDRGLGFATGIAASASGGGTSGTVQPFTAGRIFSSPAGTSALRSNSALVQQYNASGGVTGPLGWPTTSEECGIQTCWITFEHGAIGWTYTRGVFTAAPEVSDRYMELGGPRGSLGVPIAAAVTTSANGGGTRQEFAGGHLVVSATTSAVLRRDSALTQTYLARGGPSGELGWPTGPETCGTASCAITFTGGVLGWTMARGVHTVSGVALAPYTASGGPFGELGMPITGVGSYPARGGGLAQDFERGYIYATGSNAAALRKNSALFQRYAQLGSQNGWLGWPLTSELCTTNACAIEFQSGMLGWTAAAGIQVVEAPYLTVYRNAGGVLGSLGGPLGEHSYYSASGGARAQHFQNGYIYHSSAGTVFLLKASLIFQRYSQLGSQNSSLGWPTSSESCSGSTCTVTFQRGSITADTVTGAVVINES